MRAVMKGVVFTELLDMVEDVFSADLVDDVIADVDLPHGGAYTAVGTYPHAEAVALVGALSARTGLGADELLVTFGRHLFGRFHALYPVFFAGVTSSFDFLASIDDVIHVEVLKLYPDAELPRFEVRERDGDRMVLVYRSPRRMGDLAVGLIDGCAQHFGDTITVDRVGEDDVEVFTLTRTAG